MNTVSRKASSLAALALAALGLGAGAARAQTIAVTLTGGSHGVFDSGAPTVHLRALKYDDNVTAPRDPASGQAVGHVRYQPVTFERVWDADTVPFAKSLATGEVFPTVVFDFYQPRPDGVEALQFRVTLSDVKVYQIHRHAGDTLHTDKLDPALYEDVSLSFHTFTIQDESSSASGSAGQTRVPRHAPGPKDALSGEASPRPARA